LAFAPVTVLPSLTYTPSANHGAPGDQITFTITDLEAGQLVIDLGGQMVYGPTTVLAGTHTHSFTVPLHPLGEPNDVLDLTILNLVDGLSVGRHVTTFTLDAAPPCRIPASIFHIYPPSPWKFPGIQLGGTSITQRYIWTALGLPTLFMTGWVTSTLPRLLTR